MRRKATDAHAIEENLNSAAIVNTLDSLLFRTIESNYTIDTCLQERIFLAVVGAAIPERPIHWTGNQHHNTKRLATKTLALRTSSCQKAHAGRVPFLSSHLKVISRM